MLNYPDVELLDARIASALNIIQNSHFEKWFSLEEQNAQKADRFLRARQFAYLIYDYFRVTGVNESVLDYVDLFTAVLRNDAIQEFDTRWDEILLSMEQFPPDDILEGLYKLKTRESEKLKTVLELCNSDIHQKKAKPEFPRLTTKVKRSFGQILRTRIFEARNGKLSQASQSRIKGNSVAFTKDKENVGNGKLTGSVRKETNAVFRHNGNKRAEPTPPPAPSEPSSRQDVRNPAGSKKSWRPKSVWENISSVVQGTSQSFLYQSIL